MNSGWKCPGCGRCYSPTTPQCFTCGQVGYSGTSTNPPIWGDGKGKITLTRDIGHGCKDPMNCGRKDGYCSKCHSEFV
jgi:hypothetical protein